MYCYNMWSLKQLLFDEIHDPFEDVQEWYVNYRDNLMKFLENAYVDKMHCGSGFRIIIMNCEDDELPELVNFVGRFVPKNNDDSDSSDELTDESDTSDE